jgi:hypothetical protein
VVLMRTSDKKWCRVSAFCYYQSMAGFWAAREQPSPSSARSRRVRACFDGMGVVEISLAEITSGYAVIQDLTRQQCSAVSM